MTDMNDLPEPRHMPADARRATRQLLESTASKAEAGSGRRWLSRTVVIGAAAGLVLTGGAAVAYVAFAPATDQGIVRCFTLPEAGTDDDYYGSDAALASPTQDGPIPITDALGVCASLWRQGALSYGLQTLQEPNQSNPRILSPVPELTACVLDNGIAGVFPADAGICSRLGLASLQP